MRYRIALLVVAVWVPGSGCARIEEVIRGPAPGTPHEQYLEGLREAGLAETALASRWREAAERALAEAVPIEAPFEELTYFPADEPSAAGYRISVRRGQVLLAEVVPEPLPGGRIFLDLFELGGDTGELLIGLLERRLDAVVYRAKFVPTIFAARQFVNHGHVKVNGQRAGAGPRITSSIRAQPEPGTQTATTRRAMR